MSALLTKAFEKWVAECTAGNLPARPDAIIFALMEREPTREDDSVPEDRITYSVNELTCGQLNQDTIVCSAVVPDDCAFSYDWICLIHQASGTLCGVIKTPVRQKMAGESLIRNFAITYSGIAQAAQITVPPQSWQVDITPELKTALKAPNHLSEIAAEGEEAQQESRDNLGLKSAATMEPQETIHDRTEGRLAIPGAFGFGHMFLPAEAIRFKSERDFLAWVKQATPGEYSVTGDNGVLPGINAGMINIRFLEANRNPPEPQYMPKAIILYTVNGDVYYNRYWHASTGYLVGWEKLKMSETGVADTLRSIAGRANNYGYPGIGGVVFAAYCINDMDEGGRIFRGSGVSGSRLAAISVTAPYSHNGLSTSTPQIVIAPPSAYPMAGTFVALSGEPTTKVSAGTSITGLFVRVM